MSIAHFPASCIPPCIFVLEGSWTLNERTLPGGMNAPLHFTGCVYKSITKKVQGKCVRMNIFLLGVCMPDTLVCVFAMSQNGMTSI